MQFKEVSAFVQKKSSKNKGQDQNYCNAEKITEEERNLLQNLSNCGMSSIILNLSEKHSLFYAKLQRTPCGMSVFLGKDRAFPTLPIFWFATSCKNSGLL
jgi:hypothetical protein